MDDGRTFGDRLQFLRTLDTDLATQLLRAAQLGHDDPASATVALRAFGEGLTRRHLCPDATNARKTFFELLDAMRKTATVPAGVVDKLDELRESGNRGAHPSKRTPSAVPIPDLIRTAWSLAEWLHCHMGGRPDEVPAYEPPTPADSNAIFRDAVLGGRENMGDDAAKYYVAKAILASQAQKRRELRAAQFGVLHLRTNEIRELLRVALHGVPAARTEMAKLVFDEQDAAQDKLEEAKWYLDWAAQDDDPEALFLLGAFHLEGKHGFETDIAMAADFFERAATHEDPRAFNALAILYRGGRGVESSPEAARDYARRSAEAGFPIGQFTYGSFLVNGVGGPEDPETGLVWLRRAARQDFPLAMFTLATLILDGARALPGESAEDLLERACQDECAEALLWTAERELAKSDDEANFGLALGRTWAAEKAEPDTGPDARKVAQAAYLRLDAYLRRLPRTQERHQELSAVWYQCNPDGSRRFETDELAARLTKTDPTAGRLSKESQLEMVRMKAGPGVDEAEIRRRAAWLDAHLAGTRSPSINARATGQFAPAPAVPKVGRNDPCPCKSGLKYKKCHGK
jgi:TPR repeat protein